MTAAAAKAERASDPLVGSVINGKFHILKAIARGGMGRVYYGTQAPLDRPVAVKVVKADSVNEEETQFLKRFLIEASILAKLQHPNVVTLFDYGRIEDAAAETYFIAMEYLDGETLGARLRARGALPAAEVLLLFRQIARGLREAHARGIVHRDLKPSNIIILSDAEGEIVKLVDFGIGKVEQRNGEDITKNGVLVGTPKYMAPEQFDGSSSPASDVYALGIIVYQLLTGAPPFVGTTLAEFMFAKVHQAVPVMAAVHPTCDAPESLEHLVYQMLARNPAMRPSLDAVFHHLAGCEEEVFGATAARLSFSGISVRPHALNGLSSRPPPAVVSSDEDGTEADLVRPNSSSLHPPGSQPIPSGTTPPPMSRTARPPPPIPGATVPMPLFVPILLGSLAMGAGGVWLGKKRYADKPSPP
ncbi:MAG TPA: serine/threonine-protein kinase, partial [Labilithrix sp.]|nr:serine/threonine-protein kinase [Labilithrix sp.]